MKYMMNELRKLYEKTSTTHKVFLMKHLLNMKMSQDKYNNGHLNEFNMVTSQCWVWCFSYFMHILSPVLTFLSSKLVPLYDQTLCFLTFLVHFTVMLLFCILPNNMRLYSFL